MTEPSTESEASLEGYAIAKSIASRDSHRWANFSGDIRFILNETMSGEAVSQYEVGSDEWADFIVGACNGAIQQVRSNIASDTRLKQNNS